MSIAGIDPILMTVQELQKFCTQEKIKLGQNCHQIPEEKINPTKKEAPPKKQHNTVNLKRLVNVMFSEETIVPMLATKEELLTKDEMAEGLKTDQVLNEAAVFECNILDKYNKDEHPELEQSCRCSPHPTDFAGSITWQQSLSTMKSIICKYI